MIQKKKALSLSQNPATLTHQREAADGTGPMIHKEKALSHKTLLQSLHSPKGLYDSRPTPWRLHVSDKSVSKLLASSEYEFWMLMGLGRLCRAAWWQNSLTP
jgi:hypothetical protein